MKGRRGRTGRRVHPDIFYFDHFLAFTIDDDARKLLGCDKIGESNKSNKIILFELLDFNPQLLLEDTTNLTKDGFYRIAWAFLRPIGLHRLHLDCSSKLQLYEYKFKSHYEKMKKTHTTLAQNTPNVYYDFVWVKKVWPIFGCFLRFLEKI